VGSESFFTQALDTLARDAGGWKAGERVYALEVIGSGDDPQVMLTGADAYWSTRAKRWKVTEGAPRVRAVVRLSEYRAALAARQEPQP
jgi:hypothetical protein